MYRIQLKQGSRTIVNHLEADTWEDILNFYNSVSTMQVSEILEVKYSNDSKPPIDDFNYKKLFKALIRNEESHISRQIILHNIKTTVSLKDIYQYIKQYLKINGKKVDGVLVTLFRS
ncbi:MAG: hypothetical protein GXO49_01360 [Chlorobi bacterium]|nr:hypothetical protein [Chlorobiota bacterium]